MGARIPPNVRPRRGGVKCEFCGRVVQSTAALLSHQASLHSQALKEKSKQKPIATKLSKVQKPEPQGVFVKKLKPKVSTETKATPKKMPSDQSSTKSVTEQSKPETPKLKLETPKLKLETPKPKTYPNKPKLDKTIEKPKMEGLKSPVMELKKKAIKPPSKVRKIEYKCPKCEKLFPVLFVAQKHIQKYHCVNSKDEKVAENSPDIIQPILLELCIYCNENFAKPHDCPNRPDYNLLTYDCKGCQQRFKSNKLFDMHVADVHGDDNETMFFNEEEFNSWKGHMESQTQCEYILMGQYSSKQIFRCNDHTDNTDNSMLLCPSSIFVTNGQKGLQVHFYPAHFGHDHKKYDLKDQYKTYTITDLIQQAGDANISSDDTDLYLQFKTLMESIVLDAAKINIDTLKTLMNQANEMMSVLQNYDEDEEVESIVNRSNLTLSTSKINEDISFSTPSSRKRTIEENGTAGKKQKVSGETKVVVKPSGKKSNTFSLADDKDSDKILQELDGANVKGNKDVKSPSLRGNKDVKSPSFNDHYKEFLKSNVLTVSKTALSKKKNVVKTKIGQFKGTSPKKVVKRDSVGGKAKDIEYEVREQDNDCNILVLKI